MKQAGIGERKDELEKVSIVIPFFNCKFISGAVSSALAQSYSNIEVIVVDDGSTKNRELLKSFYPRITLIRKTNGGTATALNEGFRRATGNYICWLSSDDMIHRQKVEAQVAFMKLKSADFSFTDYVIINDQDEIVSFSKMNKYLNSALLREGLKSGCPINGSTVMMKKELFRELGSFNEKFIFAHDYEYWIRASRNRELHFLDQPLTMYRIHKNSGTKKHMKRIYEESRQIKQQYKFID